MTDRAGYQRVMKLAEERPELISLVRLISEMGDAAFNEALDELVKRGILKDEPRASAD